MKRLALTIFLTSLLVVALTGCDEKEMKDSRDENVVKEAPRDENVLKDARDGKTYKTVKIGEQVWMAENLNYKTENSYCYKDNEANCAKYGRLYGWDAAKSACPAGWHLPSMSEFYALIGAVGGDDVAGKKLKSTSGRLDNGNGDDVFGFSALPAGIRKGDGDYYDGEGNVMRFWSSSEGGGGEAYFMQLDYDGDGAYLFSYVRNWGYSVRCLKD
ncbi:MAG: fibrobacter succinogenes major paralogous domain-containing protein [Fibrobacter sp.]|nr:fibrobacter succinogenes major paralogous domain-containing protein [Fibrobacter sp.]